jgi:hypothetical protein
VVIRYDPADLAEIRVFYHDRFLCRAICQELAGQTVSLKEIEKARANFDNYVTFWQQYIPVSAATERAKPANSKLFTDGEDHRDLRHIIIKKYLIE